MIEFSNTSIYKPKKLLSETPTVADSAQLTDCRLGKFTEVMEHTVMAETAMDDYSYICSYGSVRYAEIFKFSNIAAHVCVNPGNHPFERPTLHHFTYRGEQYGFSESNDEVFFNWRRVHRWYLSEMILGLGMEVLLCLVLPLGMVQLLEVILWLPKMSLHTPLSLDLLQKLFVNDFLPPLQCVLSQSSGGIGIMKP